MGYAAAADRTHTSKAQLLHCDKHGVSLIVYRTETSAGNTTSVVRNFEGRIKSKQLCAGQDLKYEGESQEKLKSAIKIRNSSIVS